jgi:His-Xaa-Ser system protein HxsD
MDLNQGAGMVVDASEIYVDTGVFEPDVIASAAHRYTNEFFVELLLASAPQRVLLTPMHDRVDVDRLALRFQNDLLDEHLRARIRIQTAELHLVLVQAALREASPARVEPMA